MYCVCMLVIVAYVLCLHVSYCGICIVSACYIVAYIVSAKQVLVWPSTDHNYGEPQNTSEC